MRVILFLLCIALTTNGLAANITHETPPNTKVDKVKPSKAAKRQVKRQQRLEKWEKRLGGAAANRQAKAGENGGRGKAIASLFFGLMSIFLTIHWIIVAASLGVYGLFLLSLVTILIIFAIVLGFYALRELDKSEKSSKAMALIGVSLSIVSFLILSMMLFVLLLYSIMNVSY